MEEEKKKAEAQVLEGLFLYDEPEEALGPQRGLRGEVCIIVFSLAGEWYGADIENVLEVLKCPAITGVPGLADFILGVINVRGNIISVTDLKKIFALAQAPITSLSRILVISAAGKTTGLLADTAERGVAFALASIQPALSTMPEVNRGFIRGELTLPDGRLITILDLEKIMSSAQMCFE